MEHIRFQADLAIIGDGVAALALAYLAAQRDIRAVILGKNFRGTTYSATGMISPRPDHLLSDHESVCRTAFECLRWWKMFYPQILKPQTFLIPIGPELPHGVRSFRALLERYDNVAKTRSTGLGNHFVVSSSFLAEMEPNLRRKDINGAIVVREWAVDPAVFMQKLGWKALVCTDMVKKFKIEDFQEFKIRGGIITEICAIREGGNRMEVFNDRGPLVVVNATGPWMKDVCARLGAPIDYRLRSGVQIEVPGQYFRSGIITFGGDGKYVICLQKKDVLQVGPTNSAYDDHPDSFRPSVKETEYLTSILRNLLEDKKIPSYVFLKHGFRVKPTLVDTDRPVIWNHGNAGLTNLYSLHPGKMVLALLAGDEMLDRAISDGWLQSSRLCSVPTSLGPSPCGSPLREAKPRIVMGRPLHLDGNRKIFNEIKLFLLKMRSLVKFGLFYIKFLCKPHPF